jgi:hypothetical protein
MLSAEDALFIRVYPASSPLNLSHKVIGLTGFSDRHETESLIGMKRNH